MSKNKSEIFSKHIFILSILLFCACDVKHVFPGLWPSPTPTLSPEFMDRSWLTDQPCRAPCWYGLTLGVSKISDAGEIVSQLSFIDINNVEETNEAYFDPISEDVFKADVLLYHCEKPKDSICSQLSFVNDKLVSIISNLNYKITLSEVVQKIGEPDFFAFSPIVHDFTFRSDCQIYLYWVDRQMKIGYLHSGDDIMCDIIIENEFKPSPNLPIYFIGYFMPEFFSDLNVDKGCFPWVGFAEEK